VWPRLLGFKFIYYCSCIGILPQAIKTWAWRRRNVAMAAQDAGGRVSGAVYIQDTDPSSRAAN